MALSSAERQRRYMAKLKARAAGAPADPVRAKMMQNLAQDNLRLTQIELEQAKAQIAKQAAEIARLRAPKPKHDETKLIEVEVPLGKRLYQRFDAWCAKHQMSHSDAINLMCRERIDADKAAKPKRKR